MEILKYLKENKKKNIITNDWVSYNLVKVKGSKNERLDFIDLNPLPKKIWNKKQSIDWKNCKGVKLKGTYKNKKFSIEIIKPIYSYNPKTELKKIKIKLDNNTFKLVKPSNIKNSKLSFIDNSYSKEFKYKEGDIVRNSKVLKRTKVKASHRENSYYKAYILECLFTNKEYTIKESEIDSCEFSPFYNRETVNSKNCLWNSRPDLRPFIVDKEYALYKTTEFQRDNKITLKCPYCGSKQIVLSRNIKKPYFCSMCKDNTPMTEKIVYAVLKSNNLKIETQKRFKDCRNINELPFDFYLPTYNILIEVQGIHHKKFTDVMYRDEIKRNFCIKNNINLIYIDAEKHDFYSIIKKIKESYLCKILEINIDSINEELNILNTYHKYPIKEIIKLVDSGLSFRETTKKLNEQGYIISRHTVSRKYNNFKKID